MQFRRKRVVTPIPPATLRLIQELEALRYGHALGGAYRERRTPR